MICQVHPGEGAFFDQVVCCIWAQSTDLFKFSGSGSDSCDFSCQNATFGPLGKGFLQADLT